jgi:hypothetical protein
VEGGEKMHFLAKMSFGTATLASRIALGSLANFILIGKQSKEKHAIILSCSYLAKQKGQVFICPFCLAYRLKFYTTHREGRIRNPALVFC